MTTGNNPEWVEPNESDDFGDTAPETLRKLEAEESGEQPEELAASGLFEPPSQSGLLSVRWSYSLGRWIWNRNF